MALGWLWWRAWFPVDAAVATTVGVAGGTGVALGDIHLHFAWQVWHLATSTSTLRGRRGTYGTGLALVAGLVPSGRPVVDCIDLRAMRGHIDAACENVAGA